MLALRRQCDERREEANRLCQPHAGLLHGDCHRGRIRATRRPRNDEDRSAAAETWAIAQSGLLIQESPRATSFGRTRKQQALETAACSFVLLWAFGVSAAKALFFLMTAFGAGKSDHGRFRRPSPLACMDGHGPRVTFWTCDQQLIRLHCTSSAIVCCEPMEAAEGQKFSAASRRAIEIVMVMNSQPTLHDSKPMLCRGILLLLNTKKISADATDCSAHPRCDAAEGSLLYTTKLGNHSLVRPMRFRKFRHNLQHPDYGAGHG